MKLKDKIFENSMKNKYKQSNYSQTRLQQTLRDSQYLFIIAVIRYNREALCTKVIIWDPRFLQI
jgi:hypothetical protein